MQGELLLLRLIHVLGGIFWVGSGLFTGLFLFPALAPTGPAAGQVVANLAKRRLFVVLPTVAILTMLSGLRLMMIASTGFQRDYFARLGGKTYAIAAIAAIVAFLLSVVVARPAAVKMGVLSQQAAAEPNNRERIQAEITALQNRTKSAGIISVVLLVVAAAGMAVARYL